MRPQAGGQLAGVEGLGDVVVGADLEADDDVDLGRAPGQHQHRAGDPVPAHLPTDLDAADVGQHPVEQDHVRLVGDRRLHAGPAGARFDHLVTLAPADLGHERPDALLVLDQEHELAPAVGLRHRECRRAA